MKMKASPGGRALARPLQKLSSGTVRIRGSVQRGVRNMSLFDPFDAARLHEGPTCICGRHRSQAEHDYQSRLMLQFAPVEPERADDRFEGVVAASALRAIHRRPPPR